MHEKSNYLVYLPIFTYYSSVFLRNDGMLWYLTMRCISISLMCDGSDHLFLYLLSLLDLILCAESVQGFCFCFFAHWFSFLKIDLVDIFTCSG